MSQDNINDDAEPFKSIAYSMKDLAQQQHNVNAKILRALRNHELRITRIEKHLKLTEIKKYSTNNEGLLE